MDNEKGHIRNNSKLSNHVTIRQEASNSEEDNNSIIDLDVQLEIPNEQHVFEGEPVNDLGKDNSDTNLKRKDEEKIKNEETDALIKFKKANENVNVNYNTSFNNMSSEERNFLIKMNEQIKISEDKSPYRTYGDLHDAPNLRDSLRKSLERRNRRNTDGKVQLSSEGNRKSLSRNEKSSLPVIQMGIIEERKENYNNKPNRPIIRDPIEEEMKEYVGELVVDVDKGLLVNENEFEGIDNQDLNDQEVLKRLEEEVDHLHPRKELGKNHIDLIIYIRGWTISQTQPMSFHNR
jgi:hypothetical protein